jgi:hypothetical protein
VGKGRKEPITRARRAAEQRASNFLRFTAMADATTTQLLTLLNVSALKSSKRKRPEEPFIPAPKLNKRKGARFEAEPADGIAATTGAAFDDAEATKHHIDVDLDDHTEDAVEGGEDDAGEHAPSFNTVLKAKFLPCSYW